MMLLQEVLANQTFTITNTGGGTLTITQGSNISITGADADQFILTDGNSYPINLTTGQTATVQVKFSPLSAGSKSANLHIVDDIAKSSHDILLSGTAYAPYSSLSENFDGVTPFDLPNRWNYYLGYTGSYVLTNSGMYNSSPNSASIYNSGATTQAILLITPGLTNFPVNRLKFYAKSNTNGKTLQIGTITDPSNGATFTSFGSPISLTTTYTQYTVNFDSYSGTDKYIAFKHGNTAINTYLYIDDFIWEAIPTNPIFSISPTSKNFGTVSTGSTSPQLFNITNTGVGTLTISNISALTGTNAGEFSLSGVPATPFDLTAGASQTLTANFAPISGGAKTAKFTVTHNASKTTAVDVNLSGTGQDPNYGGGAVGNGGYYFANSTSGANPAPSKPSFSWIDPVASGHTKIGTAETPWASGTDGDEGYCTVPDIGFDFRFFSSIYRTVYICSNGFVKFGTVPIIDIGFYSGHTIPEAGTNNNLIAGCWCDLDMRVASYSGTAVYYGGDANKFVVTFIQAHLYPYPAPKTQYISFQIILYPNATDNGDIKIQYNYGNSTATYADFDDNAHIGIENSDGTKGIGYRNAGTGGPIFENTLVKGPNAIVSLALQNGMNNGALPVNLQSFIYKVFEQRNIKLTWVTSREENNSGFDIERKLSGTNIWSKVGYVKGSGNTNNIVTYNFDDRKLNSGKYNYRLKQIDNNGNFKYFEMTGQVEVGIPSKFDLSQNYPNPFNPMTKIDYQLPADSRVNIIIYDITGREVKTLLHNEQKAAGYYTIDFSSSSLSSGMYFYRFLAETNDKQTVLTKKMMLIK